MSKKQFIWFKGTTICAYKLAVGILLKYVIEEALSFSLTKELNWLNECIDKWRVNAFISDCGVHLDEKWSDQQIQIVYNLFNKACHKIQKQEFILGGEMEQWDVFSESKEIAPPGYKIFSPEDKFPTGPVVELGHAIMDLVLGIFPKPKENEMWYFGFEGGKALHKYGEEKK